MQYKYILYLQCVLASDDKWILATVMNQSMAEIIHHNRQKAGNMKITLTKFQKVEDQIKTSIQSTCEIDFDVIDFMININNTIIHIVVFILICIFYIICNILGLACCKHTDN